MLEAHPFLKGHHEMHKLRNPVARSPLMRKGGPHQRSPSAIRAAQRKDIQIEVERYLGIIPGSMSRGEATRRFTRKDLEAQTRGLECRKDKGALDEIPAAYKDIDAIMANQNDLVEVTHTLEQVLTVKG